MACSKGDMLLLLSLLWTTQLLEFSWCRSENLSVSCIASEREALSDLKKGLIYQANRLDSWDGDDCCSWLGVHCNKRSGHVTKLILRNPVTFDPDRFFDDKDFFVNFSHNCLGGEISPSLLNLKHLQHLDLSMNNFSGTQIPAAFGSLQNLVYLNLSSAGFGGKLPEDLGNLSSLQHLHIGFAPLVSYSFHSSVGEFGLNVDNLRWVASLSSLKTFDLSGVEIGEVDDWINSLNLLPSLVSLNLAGCGLYAFPRISVINFTSLSSLDLQWNSFNSNIPLWLFNLTSLKQLHLGHNSFDRLVPENFERLSSLSVLGLSSNLFNISLPDSFCKLKSLVHLDLSSNYFQGIVPDCLENLPSLAILNLGENSFEGSIPDSLSNLCSLKVLDLSVNRFNSVLPRIPSGCLSNSLKELYSPYNGLYGHLPNQLEKFKNLEILQLSFNSLSGPIPFALGGLSSLRELDLSNNEFNGSLPSSLGQLSHLVKLDISNNSVTGVLSELHFEKLTELTYLSVSLNSFLVNVSPQWIPPFQLQTIELASVNVGPKFPSWLQTQRRVKRLVMSNAGISDSIPAWFENVYSRIDDLDLSNNDINGRLPAFQESHGSMRVIKLNANKFLGPITSVPQQLYLLDLSQNVLEGPLSLGDNLLNVSLYQLMLSNNLLTGDIPLLLCDIQSLIQIDLSRNRLSGRIPACLANLKNLMVLDLSNNSLSGEIPISLGFSTELHALQLQQNKLDGKIPSSFKNLQNLRILDLGDNGFHDIIPPCLGQEIRNLVYLRLHSNNFYGDIPLQLCQLKFVRVLNLGNNNLSGSIPHCVNRLSGMRSDDLLKYIGMRVLYYFQRTMFESTKGMEREYSKPLPYLKSIELSENKLSGEIPEELMDLIGLVNLNLSGNQLQGMIPDKIGNLQQLDSLDLSSNELSGPIPKSLSIIPRLGFLNLSFNELSGKIPTGNQLQTFNESVYEGNSGLCGPPLLKICPNESSSSANDHVPNINGEEKFEYLWFYAGIGPGFAFGFIGACCVFVFQNSCQAALLLFVRKLFRNRT